MFRNTVLTLLLSFLFVACTKQSATDDPVSVTTKLTITGSSTIAPLIAQIARQYEREHPDVRIDVQTGGSTRGLIDVQQGTADIGMVSKHVVNTEQVTAHLIARDGVTMIVHKDNPMNSIDATTIKNIYLGKSGKWSDLGFKNEEDIVVVSKAEGRSTLSVFLEYLNHKNSELKPDVIIGDNEQAIKLVSANPYAIAYVSTSTAEYNIKLGVPIKSLAIANIAPTEENIASGTFPVVRELNLVTGPKLSEAARTFIHYVNSPDARSITREFKFVPVI